MFETYKEIKQLSNEDVVLVREEETGLFAVRKWIPAELFPIFEKLKDIRHPLIPEVYKLEEGEEDGYVFYAFIEGESLEDALKKGIDEKTALSVMNDICDALACLHECTPPVIHRDIKPGNVIIDTEGRAHLVDFGAARAYRAGSDADTYAIGTRGYAAPEQYGFSQSDERTDIYACGIVLDEVMTAAGKRDRYKHVITRCTNLFPKKRYASARSLKRAIGAAAGGKKDGVLLAGCAAMLLALAFLIPSLKKESKRSVQAETAEIFETTDSALLSDRMGPYEENVSMELTEALAAGILNGMEGNDPRMMYILHAEEDTAFAEDTFIPPNVQIMLSEGVSLSAGAGTTLTNYGYIYAPDRASVNIGDGAVLNCGDLLEGPEGYYSPWIEIRRGTLHCGKDATLTREWREREHPPYNVPLIEVESGKILFDEPETAKIYTDGQSSFVYLDIDLPASVDGMDLSPFGEAGTFSGSLKIYYTTKTQEETLEALELVKGNPWYSVVQSFGETEIGDGRQIELDLGTAMVLAADMTLTSGSDLHFTEDSLLTVCDGATLRVCKGAKFAYDASYLDMQGGFLVIEEGAEVSINEDALRIATESVLFE